MNKQVKDKILDLSPNKQLLFGITCVKRMETYLEKYLIKKGEVQNSFKVSKLTDNIFINCSLDKFSHIDNIINAEDTKFIEALIPDTDEDGSYEAVLAQNTSIALAYCLDFIEKNSVEFIDYCSTKAVESVDVIAFEVLNLESSDQLISEELERQNKIINSIVYLNNNFTPTDTNQLSSIIERFIIGL